MVFSRRPLYAAAGHLAAGVRYTSRGGWDHYTLQADFTPRSGDGRPSVLRRPAALRERLFGGDYVFVGFLPGEGIAGGAGRFEAFAAQGLADLGAIVLCGAHELGRAMEPAAVAQ